MMLRPYQTAAVSAVRTHWARGARRTLVALPTGAGKTVVASALLAPYRRPIALVHTLTLLEQTQARLGPAVRVMTVQGALAAGASLDCDAVFVDEAHHIVAGTWRKVVALLPPQVPVVGCTATPERADGTPLGDVFEALVATVDYTTLLRDGNLARCDVRACGGMSPADAYIRHAGGQPGILFAPTIQACRTHVGALARAGYRAATLDSTTPAAVRARLVASYAAGGLDVLASPMALAEGFDAPRAKVCVLDRTCVHSGTYLQITNRATRPYNGRAALLLDCMGASERHGSPVADRTYSLEGGRGDGIRLVRPARRDSPRRPAALATRPAPTRHRKAPRTPTSWLAHGGWLAGVARRLLGVG